MNKYGLNKNNNSNKLIIGVSILFCTVILIAGTTTAFFTKSDSKNLDNIATTDKVTLDYKDNTTYMKNNLIPVVETDVTKFASKNLINSTDERKYTDEDICHYQDDMYACSLYEFTITNTANVSQNILISMTPIINEYNNFYFILYESKVNELNNELNKIETNTKIEQDTINFNNTNIILKPKESKTYTIVFYIKNLDIPQDDSNKRFTASILVNSITTGYKKVVQLGEGCYDFEMLEDNTYKLTKFNGINHETGDIVEGCGVTKDEEGFYSVTVPSSYAGVAVSTLGNSLFYPIYMEDFNPNDLTPIAISKHYYIKELKINEGITTIEDGIYLGDIQPSGQLRLGLFSFGGINLSTQQPLNDVGVIVTLPNSLKYLGDYAFNNTLIKEIKLPNNLEYIGNRAIANNDYITEITIPASVKEISENGIIYNGNLSRVKFEDGSRLITIGDSAFYSNDISTLTIPNSVQTIGDYAFAYSQLTTLTIPSSVQTIGDSAFSCYGERLLQKVTFENTINSPSQLKEIGVQAFYRCNLTYETEEDPLIIPSNVEYIGSEAFVRGNNNLKFIKYTGNYLDKFDSDWYMSSVATLITEEKKIVN